MRITILQGAFLPVPPVLGGAVEKMWFELGHQFQRKGHKVVHVSRSYPGFPEAECIDSIVYRRVRGSEFSRFTVVTKWRDLIYSLRALRILPPSDILVTNTFWMPILASPRQSHLGRIMVDVARMPKGQMKFYRRSACLRANTVAVQRAILDEDPSLSSRIRIIPNPLPFHPYEPSDRIRKKLFLYCGRIHPEKGIELLLNSFKLAFQAGMKDWSLRLVGPVDISVGGGGFAWLEILLNSSDFSGLPIEWVGPVADERLLHQHYCEASIFVYPSLAERGETFGSAPLEAMSFGAVPIVSKLDCFNDFVSHRINGIVFDHRSGNAAQQLADAMLSLSGDSALLTLLSSRAIGVRESHHPSIIADQFLDCFDEMLNNGKRC